ncbi:MAG: PQQ-binding-like beta-propeller repeat protein [Lentisphaerales bacterium]|nr:PQQ-binding-like beta-propeller repeat protein [Lentisphaerales bacterium]
MTRQLLILLFLIPCLAFAEWPKFLGPNGNDTVEKDSLFNPDLSRWQKAWEVNVELGYSATAVVGDFIYTMGHDGKNTEKVLCLDVKTGKTVWTHTYEGILLDKQHTGGPNTTPTIEGDKLYTLGKAGQIFCLNKADGSVVWKADLKALTKLKLPNWGYASSPVTHGDMILLSCGRTVVLNKKTGKLLWMSKSVDKDEKSYISGYATPVVFDYNGTDYVTFYLGTGLEILNVKDGSRVARYDLTSKYNMVSTTPIVVNEGKNIFLSWMPYSAFLEFDGKSIKSVWKEKNATRSFQNNIVIDGVAYGTHGHFRDKRTKMQAFDLKSGKLLWEEKFPWSQIIAVGDTFVCQNINGNLTTAKVSKEKFEQISSMNVLGNVCWTKPTYSNGRLFVRNNLGRLICYQFSQ